MNELFGSEVKETILGRFKFITEFARTANINEKTLNSILKNGNFDTAEAKNVAKIASALEVDAGQLARCKLIPLSQRFQGYVEVPLYGSISAGQPIEMIDVEEYFPANRELVNRYKDVFFLRVSGNSMDRILPDGCYALVHPCNEVEHSGDPYVVTVGTTDATVKRVYKLANGYKLAPDSTDTTWRSRIYDFNEEDTEEVRIIGRVVWYCVPLNWRF